MKDSQVSIGLEVGDGDSNDLHIGINNFNIFKCFTMITIFFFNLRSRVSYLIGFKESHRNYLKYLNRI